MDLVLLVPLTDNNDLPPGLLPIQPSWSSDPWEMRIIRLPLNQALVPQAFSNLPDVNAKMREVFCISFSHRPGVAYLYTKGSKEEVMARSADSVLCVDEAFIHKLITTRVVSKVENGMAVLTGTMHKRGDLVVYQALLSNSDIKHLFVHVQSPNWHPSGSQLTQVLHSSILQLPTTVKTVAKSDITKEGKAASLLFQHTLPVFASSTTSSTSHNLTSTPSSSSTITTNTSGNINTNNPNAVDNTTSSSSDVNLGYDPQTSSSITMEGTIDHPSSLNIETVNQEAMDEDVKIPEENSADGFNAATERPLREIDILNSLPAMFSKAVCSYIVRPVPKLLDTPQNTLSQLRQQNLPATTSPSFPASPYPYLTTETQIQRGRDRQSEEDSDRIIALHYLIVLHNRLTR